MVRYKIVTCLYGHDPVYAQMFNVLRWSVGYLAPDAELIVVRGDHQAPPAERTWWHTVNTVKLDAWVDVCLASAVPVVCIDSDTMVLGSLWPAFSQTFDVAITTRHHARLWFNAGVFFYRPTQAAREFVTAWRDINRALYAGTLEALQAADNEFNGMNQPALLHTLRRGLAANVAHLPGAVWNCCASEWHRFHLQSTRVLHIQPGLRDIIFGGTPPSNIGQAHAAHVWRTAEEVAHASN